MHDISPLRLNLLRGGYLLLVVGIGAGMWPVLLRDGPELELMHGATLSMLCAVGLLAILGLRYPLRMLPLLMFEMTWKTIWRARPRHKIAPSRQKHCRSADCFIGPITFRSHDKVSP